MTDNADETAISVARTVEQNAPGSAVRNGSNVAQARPVDRLARLRAGQKHYLAPEWNEAIGVPASFEIPPKYKPRRSKWDFGPHPQGYTSECRVYFIREPLSGAIKIGMALDAPARMTDLQAGSPYPLELLGFCPGGPDLEATLHEVFKADRLVGEWFRASPELHQSIRKICNHNFRWSG